MVINKLLSDDVVKFWEYIKYGAAAANGMLGSHHLEKYCRGLLCNLLSGKYQCWMGISDDRQRIVGIAITKIDKDIGGSPMLVIDTLYAYDTADIKEQVNFVNTIKQFGEELMCESVCFFTSNDRLAGIAERYGFVEKSRLFKMSLEGGVKDGRR